MGVAIQRTTDRILTVGKGVEVIQPGVGAGNGLLNNLIGYWPGNELGGNLLDAHTNNLDLTDINTVTSNTGLVYATARQYTVTNNEYHTRNNEALLQMGDTDATFAVWAYLDDLFMTRAIIGKDVVATREYLIMFNAVSNRFRVVFGDGGGGSIASLDANTFGVPLTNTWYFIVVQHSAQNNMAYISVNDGAVDSTPTSGPGSAANNDFVIGGRSGGTISFNGRIGPTAMWKSAAGGGGCLTAAQITALYNSGAGLQYSEFTS